MSAPARRDVVRFMVSRGLSERRALRVIRMSASALRYQSAPDRNEALCERIVVLAQGISGLFQALNHVLTATGTRLTSSQ